MRTALEGAGGISAGPSLKHRLGPKIKFLMPCAVRRHEADAQPSVRPLGSQKEVVIGFGHPVYTVVDPRHNIIKEVARQLSRDTGAMKMLEIADRIETVMA